VHDPGVHGRERTIQPATLAAMDATERCAADTEVERLAEEHAALRRVATLVAREAPRAEVFTAIAEEICQVLGTEETRMLRHHAPDSAIVTARWGRFEDIMPIGSRIRLEAHSLTARVFRTARPARIDAATVTGVAAERMRALALRVVVAAPIVVEGRLWGAMITLTTRDEPLPPETESRLAQFTELMATAIASAESRARAEQLTEEQAALRRVATLVARGVAPESVFRAVAAEVSVLSGADVSAILRFEGDGTVTVLGEVGGPHQPGARATLDPGSVVDTVRETSRSARFDTDDPPVVERGSFVRMLGVRSAAASPIVVEGELWGAITVASRRDPLSPYAERRLTEFTELVATAVANAGAREELSRLAEEQAALRAVAELVARESSSAEVFHAVTEEARRVLETEAVGLLRFESEGTATLVAQSHTPWDPPPLGTQLTLEGENVVTEVVRTGRAARADDWANATGAVAAMAGVLGIRSVVATPIVVEGRPWGTLIVATSQSEPLPSDTEGRLEQFAGLVATAIANTEARAELSRLAEEQAALRRVATLVAEGASPRSLFDAVAMEMERLLVADSVSLARYEPDEQITVLVDRVSGSPRSGERVSVEAPIVVQGRLWGVAMASWTDERSPPADTEKRMRQFAQLLETAIANADSLDQLIGSRARLVTAGDAARRRVVRDLHDGAQQRLVHTIVTLKLARQALGENSGEVELLLAKALEYAERSNAELRELAHGLLPASLANGGVGAGVDALIERVDLPVRVDVPDERFEPEIEASAYFIVAEALTNVVKHARATAAEVTAYVERDTLHVEVHDDGVGGADRDGHGLLGLADRAAALGGRLEVESPVLGGTRLAATLPLSDNR
jgi:signal transduction histidine kinase